MIRKIHTERTMDASAYLMLYRCIADRMYAVNHDEMVSCNEINMSGGDGKELVIIY